MADQRFLEAVRRYLWQYLLWRNNEGHKTTFENLYKVINSDVHHAVQGEYFLSLGSDFKERMSAAKEKLQQHESQVNDIIEELLLQMDKKKSKEAINKISAQAVLEPLLTAAGMAYYIEYQKTGVKINVQLLPKKKAQLYMSYSRVCNESDKLLPWISEFKRMYEYFGSNSGIVNISNEELNMFGET